VVAVDQLARVLGPDWQQLGYGQLEERADRLEQAARLARSLAAYMAASDAGTAAEALARLQAPSVPAA